MRDILPIALFSLGGVLAGGAWSLRRQGASRTSIAVLGVLAVVSLVAGILWLLPDSR